MKKAVITIIVLAVLGGGAWWATHRTKTATPQATPASSTTTPTAATPAAHGNTVTFDGSSFSPSTLTVKSGTTVTFTNNSDTPVWPASNPHPTHTDLPGFDAGKGLGKGESYSFTFVKKGSWGYHDHLDSGIMGTIVVQ